MFIWESRARAVLSGDGIGPEVMEACLQVLYAVQEVTPGFYLEYQQGDAGFYCTEKYGTNLPEQTTELFKESDACLKGPMTAPEDVGASSSVAVT